MPEKLPISFEEMNPYDAPFPILLTENFEAFYEWFLSPDDFNMLNKFDTSENKDGYKILEGQVGWILNSFAEDAPNITLALDMITTDVKFDALDEEELRCYETGTAIGYAVCKRSLENFDDMTEQQLEILDQMPDFDFVKWRKLAELYGWQTSRNLRKFLCSWVCPAVSVINRNQVFVARGASMAYFLIGLRQAELDSKIEQDW